jgi:eukaryotic-like serine/threonine-protein kinase
VERSAGDGAGRLVGARYELEAPIGKGGVGEVWRARHVALNAHVAIKLLQPASADKDCAKRRFTAEAQITAQLKSPHAVQVFDFGVTDDGQPYLVMELLEGETLGARLARSHRLGVAETTRLLGQAVKALQRAHQLGIVHRDFKPDNVIICVDDEGRDLVKVVDFGVAKLAGVLEEGRGGAGPSSRTGAMVSLTRTGTALGTPLYMAPEQVRDSADVDHRADIWALGVVAFECLTGRVPFGGDTLNEVFQRIQSGLHKSASFLEETVPAAFDAWFDRACALDPAKRFPDAATAYKHLTAALGETPVERERVA